MAKSQANTNLIPRPPVVSILGHIDHGKSTLLDYIRKTNLVAKEAGGITQHLSAYEIEHKRAEGGVSKITFLDTPGHEAFSKIRTRGAGVADIAVLIVSGEDGVKPQTLEVLKCIKESNTPYIVAITKMDKPSANLDSTRQSLAENDVFVEGYGGDISVVAISAKTGQGVDELLDMIILQAELLELKGDPDAMGEGVVVESRLDPKRGTIATCIVKNGTVRRGTFAASTGTWAPLRFIMNAGGENIEELSFSSPIQIIGWDNMPQAGAEFKTFLKKEEAVAYVEENLTRTSSPPSPRTRRGEGGEEVDHDIAILPLILKADTAGSLEAVESEIAKLARERIVPKVISSGVGTMNEKDVKRAVSTPGTIILGFNAKMEASAVALAERSGVEIANFSIIYELTDKVVKELEIREPRIEVEEVVGSAKILRLFSVTKTSQVLGGRVLAGKIPAGASVKIIRREVEIGRGRVKELQQSKIKISEVTEGTEFGAMIDSKTEIAPGDVLEAVTLVTK